MQGNVRTYLIHYVPAMLQSQGTAWALVSFDEKNNQSTQYASEIVFDVKTRTWLDESATGKTKCYVKATGVLLWGENNQARIAYDKS